MVNYPAAVTAPPAARKWTMKTVFLKRWWLALGLAIVVSASILRILELIAEAEYNNPDDIWKTDIAFLPEVYVVFALIWFVPAWVFLRFYLNSRLHRAIVNGLYLIWTSEFMCNVRWFLRTAGPYVLPWISILSCVYVVQRLLGIGDIIEAALGIYSRDELDALFFFLIPDVILILVALLAVITGFTARKMKMPLPGACKASIWVSIIAVILSVTRIGMFFSYVSMVIADELMKAH